MPAKKYNDKSLKKAKAKAKTRYNCDEVEKYLDKAIISVKKDIIPRINAIDKRDKEQFKLAKDHIANYATILDNQSSLKSNQIKMKEEIIILSERQRRIFEDFVPQLKEGMDSIHEKLDAHIVDEEKEFQEIRLSTQKVADKAEAIQRTLDNVSANGNRGLSTSLTDIYEKLKDLEKITEGAKARTEFWLSAQKIINTNALLKPFKSKIGTIVYAIAFVIIINTILHSLGIEFDAIEIIKRLILIAKGQG
jgi:hypothetical protein